jgi:D-alanyl-D-alanine carboxypeptidase
MEFPEFLKIINEDQCLPNVSARSWSLWKRVNNKYVYIYGKRPYKQREIASLTKMMVALIVEERLARWNI